MKVAFNNDFFKDNVYVEGNEIKGLDIYEWELLVYIRTIIHFWLDIIPNQFKIMCIILIEFWKKKWNIDIFKTFP